jgi:hypothetical protein
MAVALESPRAKKSTIVDADLGSKIVLAGVAITLTWLFAFWSLVVRARLATGEWPDAQSGNPIRGEFLPATIDPKFFQVHSTIVWTLLLAILVIVPAVGLMLPIGALAPRVKANRRVIVVFLLSVALAAATIYLDPWGRFEWFVD